MMKMVNVYARTNFINGGWMNFINRHSRKIIKIKFKDPFDPRQFEWIITSYHGGMMCVFGEHINIFMKEFMINGGFQKLVHLSDFICIEDDEHEMRCIKCRSRSNWPDGMSWLASEEETRLHSEITDNEPTLIDPITKEVVAHGFLD